MVQEEIRKGPWTEQEDMQLVFYVKLFGDRRWDFIANVSGLRRTGKSCRLRWVNYLHPGLKRGKMTPHEERLVLELQSKWGNRWSKIARKLPGRTDNEIKNYWRTHMRKKAQERKKANISSSSLPTSSLSNTSSKTISSKGNSPTVEAVPIAEIKERNFYDTGGFDGPATGEKEEDLTKRVYTLDEIWNDFEFSHDSCAKPIFDGFIESGSGFPGQRMASPVWNVSLWTMEEEESKMFPPTTTTTTIGDQFYSFYNQDNFSILTG